MINKVRSFLLFPLVVIFSKTLKGKKEDFSNFLTDDKRELNNQSILNVDASNYNLFDDVKYFFDKKSPLYDKTLVKFKLNELSKPEENKKFSFDFFDVISIYYAMSMLGARIPNENIFVELDIKKFKLNDSQINNLLRYILLVYASRKVDRLFFDISNFDEKTKGSLLYFTELLNSSKVTNFTKSRGLFVLTCENKRENFDVVWSSGEDIELTDFGKVYDKFGNEIKEDIKVTNSPIIAIHKT